jgi:hypothetical protein
MHTACVMKVHMLRQKGPSNGREFSAPEKHKYLKDYYCHQNKRLYKRHCYLYNSTYGMKMIFHATLHS